MRCLLIPASRHELIRQEMWLCTCRSNKPQPPALTGGVKKITFQANSSPAQAKVTAAAKWGWQHNRPACTHTCKDLCPRCINHKLLPQRKGPGQTDDYIKRMGLPSVTISAKCPVLTLTPARFVILPIHALSLFLLSAHSSLSVSLKVSQFQIPLSL